MQKIALVALSILLLNLPQPLQMPASQTLPQASAAASPTLWAPTAQTARAPARIDPPPQPVAMPVAPEPEPPSFKQRTTELIAQLRQNPDDHPLIGCSCNFSAQELDSMFIKGQVGYGGVYLALQQETGLCPLWNAAIDAAESGHFTSLCAPNNVSGFGFDGRRYMSFESIEACMTHKSRFLATHYLTPGGRYYRGESLKDVCYHYNGSSAWHKLVVDVAYGMLVRGQRASQ